MTSAGTRLAYTRPSPQGRRLLAEALSEPPCWSLFLLDPHRMLSDKQRIAA